MNAAEIESSKAGVAWWRIHRRLYDWVLSWADSRFAIPALFLIAFAESSFFPIPPDVLLIALALSAPGRWFKYALICTLGSVCGGLGGYAIGLLFMETLGQSIINFYQAQEYYQQVLQWYNTYGVWIVFTAAFTPIPYKVFTISSGACEMNIVAFALVSFVGRGLRFFLVALLLARFGPKAKALIDKHFDLLSVLFVVLLVGAFFLISMF